MEFQKLKIQNQYGSIKKTQKMKLKLSFLRQASIEEEYSLKNINLFQEDKRKSTIKSIPSSKFKEKSSLYNLDFVKEQNFQETKNKQNRQDIKSIQLIKTKSKHKPKGVRFKQRISIQKRQTVKNGKQTSLNIIPKVKKISLFDDILQNQNSKSTLNLKLKPTDYINLVKALINSPVQSNSVVIHELKCFMCHYPQHNSPLFGKKVIKGAKKKLQQINTMQLQQGMFFKYQDFGYLLQKISDINYDSSEVTAAFETFLEIQKFPTSIKLMLYYLGSYLFQLNNLYDKAEEILRNLFDELMKFKLYDYVGIYLFLIVRMKANLLEWQSCTQYLMKLLAYAWLYKFDNLEIWIYFELSRSYFFLNKFEESQYFKVRSQMCIIQPNSNIYRQLVGKQFKNQVETMRIEHKSFDLNQVISIYELKKIVIKSKNDPKPKDTLKLQSQIKTIHEHCKIRHVKDLLARIHSSQLQSAKTYRLFANSGSNMGSKTARHMAGNPLLRTHQSGLKNLRIYFRKNVKGQSLMHRNRQPQLFTFQNSNKNILVIKQICRNILLQMKWFLPIN